MMRKIILMTIFISTLTFSAYAQLRVPDIATDKLLTKEERETVKQRAKGLLFNDITPAKNDYVDRYSRGTVHFNPEKETVNISWPGGRTEQRTRLKAGNYSFHKVIIPDGTTVEGANFTQLKPHTDAISGSNLTFRNCNLVNVEIDPSWTLIDSLHVHKRKRVISNTDNGDGTHTVIWVEEIEKGETFEEVGQYEEVVHDTALSSFMLPFSK